MRIEFPWPGKDLSPNARVHRMTRAAVIRNARGGAYYIARTLLPVGKRWSDKCHLEIEFRPPDRRKRDLDNMLASIKATLDGLSDAMGIDDSGWTLTLTRGELVKGGAVIITIQEEDE